MNNLDWDDFRYFIAAVETGSLSTAAKQLNSNQPTVGRHIDALESALEIKLFQRHTRGLTLTIEGSFIYEQSQLMLSSVVKIQRTIQGENKAPSGIVRIAVPEGLCMEVLIPALPAFYQQFPNINLILNVSPNTANLTRGEADIAIRLFRPKEADLVVKHLGDMTMGLFASEIYYKSHGIPSNLSELKTHHIITYGDQLASLEENQWLARHSDPAQHVISSDNTTTRLKATLTGLGISIQPRLFSTMNPTLVPVLENITLPTHKVWLVYHADLRHVARIRSVVEFLSSTLTL